MSKILLGIGILNWDGSERRSNRYGAIALFPSSYNEDAHHQVTWNDRGLKSFDGKRVRITCKVIESRKSGHIGDLFLGIFPSQPEVGEIVDCGIGTLRRALSPDGELEIHLVPSDGRRELWIDPRKLYRLHDQTVELYAEETTDADTPAPDLSAVSEGVVDTKDGFQVKKAEPNEVKVGASVQPLGDGMFIVEHQVVLDKKR